jgi:hypothetical protein
MSDLIAITYKGQKAFDVLVKLGELQTNEVDRVGRCRSGHHG